MWNQRPSQILHLEDELHAYFFDRAVTVFGTTVEADLREATDDAKDKRQAEMKYRRRLSTWLDDGKQAKRKGQFRDPMIG